MSYYRGLHYNAEKKMQGVANQYTQKSESPQNGDQLKNQKTVKRLADEYNVSKNTISRDAQLSKAIDAIGENSLEAKREILSGASGITRQHLQELAQGGSDDEIRAIADSIEQGIYEKPKKTAVDQFTPIDLLDALNVVMAKMAEAYSADMWRAENDRDAVQIRAALRGHIDKLEDLYRSI